MESGSLEIPVRALLVLRVGAVEGLSKIHAKVLAEHRMDAKTEPSSLFACYQEEVPVKTPSAIFFLLLHFHVEGLAC